MECLTLSASLSSKLVVFLGGGLQWQQLRKHLMPSHPRPQLSLSLSSCLVLVDNDSIRAPLDWLTHEARTQTGEVNSFSSLPPATSRQTNGDTTKTCVFITGHQLWMFFFFLLTLLLSDFQEECQMWPTKWRPPDRERTESEVLDDWKAALKRARLSFLRAPGITLKKDQRSF